MVEGANNTSTESESILLGDYLEREFVRLHSARLTDRLVRRSLDERRLQYRYLDADGNLHAGSDLPKGYSWRTAEISREEHAVTWPAKPIPRDPWVVDILARQRAAEDHLHVFRTGRSPPPRPPPPPVMAPAFEIFRVKVLVWRVGPTPREEPTETAPAESEPVKTALSELMQVKPKNSKDWLFDKRSIAMPITKRRCAPQVESITGRDGYLQMQALAYAIVSIEQRPKEFQEWSNKEDMKALLDHYCSASLKQHFLDNAVAHLTGVGHRAGGVTPTNEIVAKNA